MFTKAYVLSEISGGLKVIAGIKQNSYFHHQLPQKENPLQTSTIGPLRKQTKLELHEQCDSKLCFLLCTNTAHYHQMKLKVWTFT